MQSIGIIMNGVTGRMGLNQHLIRSLLAIRAQGGVRLTSGEMLCPEPILVGRNPRKLEAIARAHGLERWTTDLAACLDDPQFPIYFDAQTTTARPEAVRAAIAAGKHIYCEKPLALDLDTAVDLAQRARQAGVKTGIVHDKLFLPGFLKLKRLVQGGFFGRIMAARLEFGYWVFEGDWQPSQRPSWNYRKEEGGGIVLDMFSHWQYVLEGLLAPIESLSCLAVTHIPERVDEAGRPYAGTAEDAAYATFRLTGGIVAQANSSWCVRVHRKELVSLQVDGTEASAVAGLWHCDTQHRAQTPRAVWNPDIPDPHDYYADWQAVPDNTAFDNGFKVEWEMFLRHVAEDAPFSWDFREGARGIQVTECALRSWRERCWVDVPQLQLEG